jgi:hypothetical protein
MVMTSHAGNIIASWYRISCPCRSFWQHTLCNPHGWYLSAITYIDTIAKLEPLLVTHELQGHLLEAFL